MNKKQEAVQDFWNDQPCGTEKSDKERNTRDFYNEIEENRYSHQKHILTILDNVILNDKKVLEIGTGVGTDARTLIKKGAQYTGINVDAGSVEATKNAFTEFNLKGDVFQMSATEISFQDSSHDLVYSFGVLHHIPEANLAVKEIHRILVPSGGLLIMVYNRPSINYYIEIMFLRKLIIKLLAIPKLIDILGILGFPKEKLSRHKEIHSASKRMTNEEWLSRNTDGPDSPFSKVYNKKEIKELLVGFEIKYQKIYFFDSTHWGFIGKLMPEKLVDYLGKHWGWHRVVYAVKTDDVI